MQDTYKILLSPRAKQQVQVFKDNNPQWEAWDLRLYIEGKGCDGFTYGVSFDLAQAGDVHFPQFDDKQDKIVDLVIDPDTIKYVNGSTINWIDDERGKGFLVENPLHKKFRGKFFKREGWEQKLFGS